MIETVFINNDGKIVEVSVKTPYEISYKIQRLVDDSNFPLHESEEDATRAGSSYDRISRSDMNEWADARKELIKHADSNQSLWILISFFDSLAEKVGMQNYK